MKKCLPIDLDLDVFPLIGKRSSWYRNPVGPCYDKMKDIVKSMIVVPSGILAYLFSGKFTPVTLWHSSDGPCWWNVDKCTVCYKGKEKNEFITSPKVFYLWETKLTDLCSGSQNLSEKQFTYFLIYIPVWKGTCVKIPFFLYSVMSNWITG